MNNFFTLTKVFFLSGFNVNSKKKNQKSALGLFGLTLVLFAISSLGISFSMIMKMKEASLPIELFLCVLLMMGFMLNFIISIFQLQSIIFNTKDYELLESLPISKPCIIAAKLFATYLINVAEDVALILPALGIYFANGGTIVPGILSFVSALLISVVPILLSAIIGSISALISAKSRHSNLINIILSLLFFVVFFGGYFYINYAGADMLTGVLDHVFFLRWMKDALLGEYINYLYFVLFNLGGAIIVTLMISLIYRPVNTWLKAGAVHVDYDKVKKNNEKVDLNLDKVLLKKEWNMVSRRPQYLINCVLGQFFFLIFAIMFILLPNMFVGGSEEIPESLPLVFAMLVAPMGMLMNSIATTTSSSISFEGRNGYELLRSYPIDPMSIIKAKIKIGIILSVTVNLFVSTIAAIIMIVKGFYMPYQLIPVYLYPLLAGIVTALVGTLTGLRWPKLDFENEAQVLKNSAASNFIMLFVMLPSMILFGIHMTGTIFGIQYFEFIHYITFGVITIIYLVTAILLTIWIKNRGRTLFDRIITRH